MPRHRPTSHRQHCRHRRGRRRSVTLVKPFSARWLFVGLLGLGLGVAPGATYGQSRDLIDAVNQTGAIFKRAVGGIEMLIRDSHPAPPAAAAGTPSASADKAAAPAVEAQRESLVR